MVNKIICVLALVALVVSLSFALREYKLAAHQSLHSAQLLPASKATIEFRLEQDVSTVVTTKDLIGRWSLIFFGFTNCPDFCPLELQKLGKLLELAQQDKDVFQNQPLHVIFISLDPERDTAEKLTTYTAFFHNEIRGLRGSNTELAKISHFFGADYSRVATRAGSVLSVPAGIDMPIDASSDYQVDHSARIYIVNPQAAYIGSFAPPHNAERIWEDLQVIVEAYNSLKH